MRIVSTDLGREGSEVEVRVGDGRSWKFGVDLGVRGKNLEVRTQRLEPDPGGWVKTSWRLEEAPGNGKIPATCRPPPVA